MIPPKIADPAHLRYGSSMPNVSEAILRALVVQMIRSGKLSHEDIGIAAEELRREGEDTAAQNLESFVIMSLAEPASHYEAEVRRGQFRVIDPD
jgi:hypothetical protein